MILNTQNLTAMFTSFSKAYQDAFAGAPNKYDQVASILPSSSEQNLYSFLGQFPSLREWLGDRQIKNLKNYDYTLRNKEFESTIAVPRPKIRDDQYGAFSLLFAEMGRSAKVHPDELVFALLKLGASTLCYDGQYFFDTDHPVKVNGTDTTAVNYDSVSGGTGNLWVLADTSRPLKPMVYQKREDYSFQSFTNMADEHVFMRNEFLYGVHASCNVGFGLWQLAYGSLGDLSSTNVDSYVATMSALQGDESKPLGVMPDTVFCGPSNWSKARAVFMMPTLSGGAANPNYQQCKVVVSPYLT